MTRAIIKWSAENRWIVLLASAAVVLFGAYALRTIPVDAIPDLSDTQVIVYSRWDRSPDIVEDQVTYPIVTALLGAPEGEDDPRLLRLRLLLRLRHLRGRHRHLLGPQPRRRVPLEDPARAAGGRAHRARARRHRRRLGLPVRPRRRLGEAQPRRPPHVPGLDAALPPAIRARGRRGGHRSAASSSSTRSRSTRTACKAYGLGIMEVSDAVRQRQRRGGRPPHRDVGHGVHGARPGLRRAPPPTSSRSSCAPTRSARRSSCATWPRWRSAPRSAAASAISTASATPWAGSW